MEEQVPNKRAYLVGGLGCAGKSTFAKKLANDLGVCYVRADDIYWIVFKNLDIAKDKLVYAPMSSTWEKPEILGIPDFGIYGSMRECVKADYLEFFSYNIPKSFVIEGEAIFWNKHERALVEELLSDYNKTYFCLYPEYEQWLKNRTKRSIEGGHPIEFRDEDEYNKLYEEYLTYMPDNTIIIKDALSECSLFVYRCTQ